MERRNLLLLVAVVVIALLVGAVGTEAFDNDFLNENQESSVQENLRVTNFTTTYVNCSENILPGVTLVRGRTSAEHQTNTTIEGNVPVSSPNATLRRPKITNMPTHYVINITNSDIAKNQSERGCVIHYRMNYTIPHGGTDIYTVTLLHNGRFVYQEYNSRFNNGTLVSGSFAK